MDYKISHTTVYSYSAAVPICHNEVHLTPRDSQRQSCLSTRLVVKPWPTNIESTLDYFGNIANFFTVQEAHQKLTVTSVSKVRMTEPAPPPASSPPWETVRDCLAVDRSRPILDAYQFVFESPHVQLSDELAAYGAVSFTPGRPWLEGLLDLTGRIYGDFKYDKTATTIRTPLERVMQQRRGVCQDFAQLEIGCLRSLGLAARYVSGYLLTAPPQGQPRLIGADASHAWLSAFAPEMGWIDVDPTNNQMPTTKHITLAWGRDYSDVTPIKGVYIGGGQNAMTVAVDVAQLADGAD
jgi:transglutaminase-like putative cysteine protease